MHLFTVTSLDAHSVWIAVGNHEMAIDTIDPRRRNVRRLTIPPAFEGQGLFLLFARIPHLTFVSVTNATADTK